MFISQPMIVEADGMFALKIRDRIGDDDHVLIFCECVQQLLDLGIWLLLARDDHQSPDLCEPVFDVFEAFFSQLTLAGDSRKFSGVFGEFKLFSLRRIERLAEWNVDMDWSGGKGFRQVYRFIDDPSSVPVLLLICKGVREMEALFYMLSKDLFLIDRLPIPLINPLRGTIG